MASLFDIGISGLRAQQTALSVTGQNITNASTPGYSRQRVALETQQVGSAGTDFGGAGVRAGDVGRLVDEFTLSQIRTDNSMFSEMNNIASLTQQIEAVLSDAGAGIDSVLQEFFGAMQSAANEPRSVPARQYLISQASALSARFQALDGRFNEINRGVDVVLAENTDRVNELASTIAGFNDRIAVAESQERSGAGNSLKDQRDQALEELSGLIRVTTSRQENGQLNVFIGKGQALVLGSDTNTLSASDGELYLTAIGAAGRLQVTSSIDGGELGGLVKFRDTVLHGTQDQLGRLANGLAASVNEVHRRGVDLNGNFGAEFFSDLNRDAATRSRIEAVAGQAAQSAGSLRVFIDEPLGNYADEYELSFGTDSTFSVIRRNDGAAVAQGELSGAVPETVSFDGLTLVFESDSYAAGDRFAILPNRTAAGLFEQAVTRVQDLALAAPVRVSANEANQGSGSLRFGEVFDVEHPVFSGDESLVPPLLIRFNSPTSYDVLDNSNPQRPVPLTPPLEGLPFSPGQSNELFSEGFGFNAVTSNGDRVGRPSAFEIGPLATRPDNGYQTETLTVQTTAGAVELDIDGSTSAADIARQLSLVPGVNASARSSLTITDIEDNGIPSELVVAINGLRVDLPDTATPNALADAITADERFAQVGIRAQSDGTTLTLVSERGDDLTVQLTGDTTDSLTLAGAAANPVVLRGLGPGTNAALGGSVDVSGGFDFSVGGPYSLDIADELGVPQTVSLTGTYGSGAALVAGVQAAVDGALGPGSITVALGGSGQLTFETVASGDDATVTISNLSAAAASSLGLLNGSASGVDQYRNVTVGGSVNLLLDPGVSLRSNSNSVFAGSPPLQRADFGFTAELSGRPQAGDRFEISFNADGQADSRNALDLVELRTRSLVGDPALTFAESYGELVAFVGSRSKEAQVGRDAASALLTQARAQRESVSGVNLDEEAVNLIRHEQAYNASAQIISVARDMFQILFNTVA